MCLFVNNPIPNVAKKPIKVYKLLNKDLNCPNFYHSICQDSIVKIGETVKASNSNYQKLFYSSIIKGYIVEGEGVHGFITKKDALNTEFYYEVITEWEIPAGAKYWLGNWRSKGEIAATEMKFIKVL